MLNILKKNPTFQSHTIQYLNSKVLTVWSIAVFPNPVLRHPQAMFLLPPSSWAKMWTICGSPSTRLGNTLLNDVNLLAMQPSFDHKLFLPLKLVVLEEAEHSSLRSRLGISAGVHLHQWDFQVLQNPAASWHNQEGPSVTCSFYVTPGWIRSHAFWSQGSFMKVNLWASIPPNWYLNDHTSQS